MEDMNEDNLDISRQLVEAQEEAKTNLAGWQRSQADFENFKKREEAKQKDILEFAKEVTIVKMMPTLDSLEQGLKYLPDSNSPDFTTKFEQWKTGIQGILQKLEKVLEEMGVRKIEAVGKPFDPNYHEAVRVVPAEESGENDGIIVEELQTGFEINGKVIRPSQVVISKKE
jgi:molecular chaperone GrpE